MDKWIVDSLKESGLRNSRDNVSMSKDFKRKLDAEDAPEALEASEQTDNSLEFKSWFALRLKDHKKLQAHHYPVILSFFKKNDLSETESEGKYDAMLKRFGY